MDLKETVQEGVDWILLVQDGYIWWAFVNTVMNINLIVAPCIFVESLQFINQRMHI